MIVLLLSVEKCRGHNECFPGLRITGFYVGEPKPGQPSIQRCFKLRSRPCRLPAKARCAASKETIMFTFCQRVTSISGDEEEVEGYWGGGGGRWRSLHVVG